MEPQKHTWPNREPDRAYTLPSRYFYDPAIMEAEKWSIFYKGWLFAAHVSEVAKPGHFVTCDIFDQSVLIVRGRDQVLRAFHNVCQHRGNRLISEQRGVKSRVFSCKFHSWTYGLDGALVGAARTEKLKNFDKREFCLKPVRVEEFAGFVYVNLEQDARSMADLYPGADEVIYQHAPDMADLKLESVQDFVAPANWKVVVDNGIEGYHLTLSAPAHKELARVLDFKKFLPEVHDNWWVLAGPTKPDLKEIYGEKIGDSPYQTDQFVVTWIFPNTGVVCLPYADCVSTFTVIPLEAEKSRIRFRYYAPEREVTAVTRAAVAWNNEHLGPEDVDLNITTQQGLKSFGYDQGRYMIDAERSCESEICVYQFHTKVYEALTSS